MNEFRKVFVGGSLVCCAGFLGLSTYGIISDNLLKYLVGVSGFVGGLGGVGSGLYCEAKTKKRLAEIKQESQKHFQNGFNSGRKDVLNNEYKTAFTQGFKNGVVEGKEAENKLAAIVLLDEQKRIATEYENKIAELERYYAAEINQLKEANESTIIELRQQYEIDLDTIDKATKAEIKALKAKIASLADTKAKIEQQQEAIQAWEIVKARYEGTLNALEQSLLDKDRLNSELSARMESQLLDFKQEYNDGCEGSFNRGYEVATQDHSNLIETLNLRIATLETRLEVKKRDDYFDEHLKSLGDTIGKDLKPVLLCGGQGSGKGTTTIALLRHYGGSVGCVPIVLDVGEGGNDDDSTWNKGGVPSTNDPRLFLELLRVTVENMAEYTHRTKEDYQKKPPIIFVCDELQTMTLGLNNDAKKELNTLLTALHTRGHKRKVFVFFCNQSYQIQNMNGILNGGQLNNFWTILFNDELLKYLEANNSLLINHQLKRFIESFEGQYKTALASKEKITPVRHPSHYRQRLGVGAPTEYIEKPSLAAPPQWLAKLYSKLSIPSEAVFVDGAGCGSESDNSGSNLSLGGSDGGLDGSDFDSVEPLEPLPGNGSEPVSRQEKITELAKKLGLTLDDVSRLEDAITSGEPKTKAIEGIGIKKGGSDKYKYASNLYELLKV